MTDQVLAQTPTPTPAPVADAPLAPSVGADGLSPTGVGSAGDAAVLSTPAPTTPEYWTDSLNEGTKAFAVARGWKDQDALVTSYQNLEKLARGAKDVVAKPNFDNADEVSAFYKEMGRPDAAGDYKFQNTPETATEEMTSWYKNIAHDAGLSTQQAENIFNEWHTMEAQLAQGKEEHAAEQMDLEVESLRTEFGQGFDQQIELAKRGWRAEGLDKEAMALVENSLGPEIAVKIGLALSKSVSEDSYVGSGDPGQGIGGAMTPEQAKMKIEQKMADPTFKDAYFNAGRTTPEHKQAVAEMERLNAYAAGTNPF